LKVAIILSLIVFSGLAPALMNEAYAQPILFGAAHAGGQGLAPSTFYSIDFTSGAANAIGPIGFFNCSGMGVHPVFLTVYATCNDDNFNEHLITIDTSSGAGNSVGLTGASHKDIAFRSDGKLYGHVNGDITEIDINTGNAVFLGSNVGIAGFAGNGLAFSLDDTFLRSDESVLNTLSDVTGNILTTTPHGYPIGLDFPRNNAMDTHPVSGVLYASTNDGSGGGGPNYLSTVDTTTAVVTFVGLTGLTVNGLDAIAFLPEPRLVGGEIIPIESTALLLAGIQSSAIWILPAIFSAVGIGLVLLRRK
jgi:hypothetical protein